MFDFDTNGNLAIASFSDDSTFVGRGYGKVIFYLSSGASNFNWVKSLSFDVDSSALSLEALDFDESNNRIMLFYDVEPVFVILDASSGNMQKYIHLQAYYASDG